MPRKPAADSKCTQCGGELARVHRTAEEARQDPDQRRYRCLRDDCGWQGLLPRPSRKAGRSRSSTSPAARYRAASMPNAGRVWVVMGGLFALLVMLVVGLMHLALRPNSSAAAPTLSGAPSSSTPPAAPALQPRR